MKINKQHLEEAREQVLDVVIVRGLGDLILRIERTEEEIARSPRLSRLLDFVAEQGLTLV